MTEIDTSAHPSSLDRRPKVLAKGHLTRWLIPVLLILVALTMVTLHVRMYTKVGPIDPRRDSGDPRRLPETPRLVRCSGRRRPTCQSSLRTGLCDPSDGLHPAELRALKSRGGVPHPRRGGRSPETRASDPARACLPEGRIGRWLGDRRPLDMSDDPAVRHAHCDGNTAPSAHCPGS